ncbi:putative cucumisin [Medicago truncatula]|uniref:Putative cucumisin n=2 Tax=Medicago truncatula TaxID=3880 RepID=A0A396JB75_MEDTR|nr:putative cucumisin [Medicago truncatula]
MRGVISVFPSHEFHLQTTRSWDFLGLPHSFKRDQTIESSLVIGVMDTGIWPESESFNDKGLGSIPKKWKGVCAGGGNFSCNKKIIGARFYGVGDVSARDKSGHGTHTASIAGGREVNDVSFYGLANGIARGGIPSSRIDAYKICNVFGACTNDVVLAAFDDAIADGVDVITISLDAPNAIDFLSDSIAIGSFHAMEKGILTVQSAGNAGPISSSVCSIILGNGQTFIGKSINTKPSNGTKFPIVVHNAQACPAGGKTSPEKCDCMDKKMVNGKLVLCGSPIGEMLTSTSGAIGNPTLKLESKDFVHVQYYKNSTNYPVAEILKSEIFHDTSAPRIAIFSSRGSNPLVQEIMKPDISAPGVEILAAYSPLVSPSTDPSHNRMVKYNILSGTSTSCPHVAGVVGYVKSFHLDWSPTAIKSAIMTTATPVKGTYDDFVGEFAYGSGNINPKQAIHPGLVYDITKQDYMQMLCNYGYSSEKLNKLVEIIQVAMELLKDQW